MAPPHIEQNYHIGFFSGGSLVMTTNNDYQL